MLDLWPFVHIFIHFCKKMFFFKCLLNFTAHVLKFEFKWGKVYNVVEFKYGSANPLNEWALTKNTLHVFFINFCNSWLEVNVFTLCLWHQKKIFPYLELTQYLVVKYIIFLIHTYHKSTQKLDFSENFIFLCNQLDGVVLGFLTPINQTKLGITEWTAVERR